ncbi:rhodanese-like domain-containing protein [Litorivicinus sp.]|nr:rhodanese-like domain-containing protein [Litorivicinus sp.]MDC1239618.1 rhodanese-like domain-containing protein [Litorivicinus sp.]
MQEFIEFSQENWVLMVLWISAVGTLYYTETKKAGKSVNTTEATRMINHDNALILDIREKKDFALGHISGAHNLPASIFDAKASEIDRYKSRQVIVVCKMGTSAGSIVKSMKKRGFENVVRLAGGISEWTATSLPVKKGKSA